MYKGSRVFDWKCQREFALASSDINPIHMDVTAARRTQAGGAIVHGIHSLLWILDCASSAGLATEGTSNLKVHFLQPVYVGDTVVVEITQPKPTLLRARMLVDREEVLAVSWNFEGAPRTFPVLHPRGECLPPPDRPADLSLQEMAGLAGCLSFTAAAAHLDTMFPHATRILGKHRIAALAYSSCLVGMVVPGLHSMYSGLEVCFCNDYSVQKEALAFRVESVVERFRLVRIAIGAHGLRGSLETVRRMPPVRQPSITRLMSVIAPGEFRNYTALIIGGSRGLGELTAKIIAAGGGHPVITYASGKQDAQILINEFASSGATCTAIAYDVRRPALEQLTELAVIPSQLYYFATPPISRRKSGLFNEQRFAEFNAFYVTGFFELVHSCLRLGSRRVQVFYPSSIFLEERPAMMTEYSMAKAAGEVLCADLARFLPDVQVIVRRLPRLLTDQTSSVVSIKTPDAVGLMLPIVREMYAKFTPSAMS